MTTYQSPRARASDPATAQHAGANVRKLRTYWAALLTFTRDNDRPEGWSPDELTQRIDLGACYWKRVSECLAQGWLEVALDESGAIISRPGRHPGPGHARQQCYRLSASGRARLLV